MRRFLRARKAFVVERLALAHGTMTHRRSVVARHERSPLILVPGAGLSGRYLLPLGALLAPDLTVWVPDPPGAGGSTTPAAGTSVPAVAEGLGAWIAALGIERAVIVANSMGCQFATELAVRHPELVAGLVLQGQTVDPTARTPWRQAARVVIDAFREPVSLWFLQASDWLRTGPRRSAAAVRAMFEFRLEDRLPLVRCPVLVVSAARDAIAPPAWSRRVHALVARSTFVEVPHAAHAMPYSSPAALADVVRQFAMRCQEDDGPATGRQVVEQHAASPVAVD